MTQPCNTTVTAIAGASESSLKLAVNVGAMLLAFIALIALLNTMLGGTGSLLGFEGITIEWLLGYLFVVIGLLIFLMVMMIKRNFYQKNKYSN